MSTKTKRKPKKKHSVTIRWGVLAESKERNKETYSFNTKAELNAFMLGVNAMDGWLGYEEVDPNEKEESDACEES